jgi:4-carboxymuconolactone decarboxylase
VRVNDTEQSLVRLSAAVATRDRDRLESALEEAAANASVAQIEEALLQSYLFLGYPATLQALAIWRERCHDPLTRISADDPVLWPARGEQVCAQVYGGQYARLRGNVARLHPDVEQWMLVEGYGKVLGRPGLDLRTRELCILGLLVAQDAPRQLYAHMRGALNAGATAEDVEAALLVAVEELPVPLQEAAFGTWRDLLARRQDAHIVITEEGG